MFARTTHTPRTHRFAQHLARALVPKVVLLVAAFAYLAPGYLAPTWDVGSDSDVMAIRPHVAGSPAALVAANDCWSGEAPADMAGVLPGHVVVTKDGETRVAGTRMVSKALGQLFEGADHGLRIHGFCR